MGICNLNLGSSLVAAAVIFWGKKTDRADYQNRNSKSASGVIILMTASFDCRVEQMSFFYSEGHHMILI